MLLYQRLGKLVSPQAYYNTLSELIWLEPREAKCCSKHCVSSDASVGSPSHLLNPIRSYMDSSVSSLSLDCTH